MLDATNRKTNTKPFQTLVFIKGVALVVGFVIVPCHCHAYRLINSELGNDSRTGNDKPKMSGYYTLFVRWERGEVKLVLKLIATLLSIPLLHCMAFSN